MVDVGLVQRAKSELQHRRRVIRGSAGRLVNRGHGLAVVFHP